MSELEQLKQVNAEQSQRLQKQDIQIQELKFQLKELTRLIPSSKSEKQTLDSTHPKQLNLFDLPKTEDS